MEFALYLRERVKSVRDGYATSPSKRRRLYFYCKQHEERVRKDFVRVKLGATNHDWLLGLIEYGDERGWYDMAVAEATRDKEAHHGRKGQY